MKVFLSHQQRDTKQAAAIARGILVGALGDRGRDGETFPDRMLRAKHSGVPSSRDGVARANLVTARCRRRKPLDGINRHLSRSELL